MLGFTSMDEGFEALKAKIGRSDHHSGLNVL